MGCCSWGETRLHSEHNKDKQEFMSKEQEQGRGQWIENY